MLCTIAFGLGMLSFVGEPQESLRYEGATVEITKNDILVNGPFDKNFSYKEKGLFIRTTKDGEWTRIETPYEVFLISDAGTLLMTQASIANEFKAASVSMFRGRCEK